MASPGLSADRWTWSAQRLWARLQGGGVSECVRKAGGCARGLSLMSWQRLSLPKPQPHFPVATAKSCPLRLCLCDLKLMLWDLQTSGCWNQTTSPSAATSLPTAARWQLQSWCLSSPSSLQALCSISTSTGTVEEGHRAGRVTRRVPAPVPDSNPPRAFLAQESCHLLKRRKNLPVPLPLSTPESLLFLCLSHSLSYSQEKTQSSVQRLRWPREHKCQGHV